MPIPQIEHAIGVLEAEWAHDIWDPRAEWVRRANEGEDAPQTRRWAAHIESYIRACGWDFRLRGRLGTIKYRPQSDEWCGFFVGAGLIHAGLDPQIALHVIPSTYRLGSAVHWGRAGYPAVRSLPASAVQRGDIVVVGHRKKYGDHITMALSSGPEFATIEGNAMGHKPSGPFSRQGVVRRTRRADEVAAVYRLKVEHFRP